MTKETKGQKRLDNVEPLSLSKLGFSFFFLVESWGIVYTWKFSNVRTCIHTYPSPLDFVPKKKEKRILAAWSMCLTRVISYWARTTSSLCEWDVPNHIMPHTGNCPPYHWFSTIYTPTLASTHHTWIWSPLFFFSFSWFWVFAILGEACLCSNGHG